MDHAHGLEFVDCIGIPSRRSSILIATDENHIRAADIENFDTAQSSERLRCEVWRQTGPIHDPVDVKAQSDSNGVVND